MSKIKCTGSAKLNSTLLEANYLSKLDKEDLLPRGWQFMIVGYIDGECVLELHYASDKGGGSYAEAKIRTLEMNPDMITTDTDISLYKHQIRLLMTREFPTTTKYANLPILSEAECEAFLTQLAAFSRLEDVPRDILDPIRDRTGLSPFGGGIRLSQMCYYEGALACPMELLVAMSGAKESMDDLLFALEGVQAFLFNNTNKPFGGSLGIDVGKHKDIMQALRDKKDDEIWRMLCLTL